jgi:Right handed beta helix region/Pel9A-like, right handed beta helix region
MHTMPFFKSLLLLSIIGALGLGFLPPLGHQSYAEGTTYYVATNGNDANRGTSSQPFRTIQKAANLVNPGDTVIVKDGVYQAPGDTTVVDIRRSGTAGNWITFKAEHKWQATLDGTGVKFFLFNIPARNIGYIRIEDFELRNAPNSAIKLNAEGLHHLVIKGNRIHHNTGAGALLGGANFLEVEANYFHDNGAHEKRNHDHAIYSNATNATIKNNIFARHLYGWGIQTSKGASNWKIINNTFAFPNPARDGHIMLWRTNTNVVIENNIFYQPRGSAVATTAAGTKTGVIIRNNLTTTAQMMGKDTEGMTASNNITSTNPQFVNPSQDDFHLQQGSPAINAGITFPEVPCDYDGRKRPAGSGYDLGAYEYGASPSTSCRGG